MNAFLIVLFRMFLPRKGITIVGGYTAACVPKINYHGASLSPLGRPFKVLLTFFMGTPPSRLLLFNSNDCVMPN